MFLDFTINFENNSFKAIVSKAKIKSLLNFVENYFQIKSNHYLIINLVEIETMTKINNQYYPFKKTSNILTFPFRKKEVQTSSENPWAEIYVCLPVVLKEKPEFNWKNSERIFELLLHAFLHLWGYHHQNYHQEKLLKNLTGEILSSWVLSQTNQTNNQT